MNRLRVAVARAEGRSDSLASRLLSAGAQVHDISLTRTMRTNEQALRAALSEIGSVRWIVLASAEAVHVLADAVKSTATDDAVADRYFAIVGNSSERAAEAYLWRADIIPQQTSAEALLDAFASRNDLSGTTVLYPRAITDRDVLADGLRALGAHVIDVPCYQTVSDADAAREFARLLSSGMLDLIAVATPAAVDALADAVPPERAGLVSVASIGPVTSKAARQAGFRVAVQADPYTAEGLARAIGAWWLREAGKKS